MTKEEGYTVVTDESVARALAEHAELRASLQAAILVLNSLREKQEFPHRVLFDVAIERGTKALGLPPLNAPPQPKTVPDRFARPISGWWRVEPDDTIGEHYVFVFAGRIVTNTSISSSGSEAGVVFSQWYRWGWKIEYEGGVGEAVGGTMGIGGKP